jgi:hypothetical protein
MHLSSKPIVFESHHKKTSKKRHEPFVSKLETPEAKINGNLTDETCADLKILFLNYESGKSS